jgi:phage host-nuclease inhibitor protein Gam
MGGVMFHVKHHDSLFDDGVALYCKVNRDQTSHNSKNAKKSPSGGIIKWLTGNSK